MNRRIKKGKLTEEEVQAAFTRMSFETSLSSLSDVDFVIEAIVENLEIKRELFEKLDRITPSHCILSTNS